MLFYIFILVCWVVMKVEMSRMGIQVQYRFIREIIFQISRIFKISPCKSFLKLYCFNLLTLIRRDNCAFTLFWLKRNIFQYEGKVSTRTLLLMRFKLGNLFEKLLKSHIGPAQTSMSRLPHWTNQRFASHWNIIHGLYSWCQTR